MIFTTNLAISKDIDLTKLANVMRNYVHSFDWSLMQKSSAENQDIAPVNAVLDLLDSRDPGLFETLKVRKDLLLKSHWQGKLREAMEMLEHPLKFEGEREDIVELYAGFGLETMFQ